MTPIYAELTRWMGLPFEWGRTDCCLLLADWVARARGLDFDPADHLRGAYDDFASCHRLTGWGRDPVAVIEGCAARVPLDRTDAPRLGDVGLLQVPHGGRVLIVGGIKTATSWAAKAPFGIVSGKPAGVLAAWSVGYAE